MVRLGQHFLLNKKKIGKIVEALDLKSGDVVIEIGPGHGELTNEVIKKLGNLEIRKFKIILIEKDEKLLNQLKEKLSENKNVEIIHGDALKILPKLITQLPNYPIANYKIVGNIPYYITGYLLRILGELITNYHLPITAVVLTIQKEVAQRICLPRSSASGGGRSKPKMNLLAASVQFWAEPKIIGYIPKKDFRPAPKVDSAIIKLTPRPITQLLNYSITNYYHFIKILFKQPRKTIVNNLVVSSEYKVVRENKEKIIEKLAKVGVNPQARPQDLNIEQIKELSKIIGNYQDLLKV